MRDLEVTSQTAKIKIENIDMEHCIYNYMYILHCKNICSYTIVNPSTQKLNLCILLNYLIKINVILSNHLHDNLYMHACIYAFDYQINGNPSMSMQLQ